MNLDWNWEFTLEIFPALLSALKVTVAATLMGMVFALILGLVLALLRRTPLALVAKPVALLIEFIRSTPLLVQLYFLFYILPDWGLKLSPLMTGVFALGIHYSTYTSEVYRAGIDSVSKGQWEAAKALNINQLRTFFTIIFPQALPPIIPALGNYLVAMFKDTPLLSTITVLELLYTAKDIGSETFRYLEPLTLVGLLFLVVSLVASKIVRMVEYKLKIT